MNPDVTFEHCISSHADVCINGSVQLVGGETPNQGRAELCVNGKWGTICGDYYWNIAAASVVCNQLGYNSSSSKYDMHVLH